jgi:hypothetical protein
VRRARAKDLSELISQTLNTSLIRWIVDLNYGTDVESPKIYRDFDPKEDVQLTMADTAILVKDLGLKPTVQWVTDRFDVELEEEEGQNMIPHGPEGSSGVDTESRQQTMGPIKAAMMRQKVKNKAQKSIPAEPKQVKAQTKYDAGNTKSIKDGVLGKNPDKDETVTTKPQRKVADAVPDDQPKRKRRRRSSADKPASNPTGSAAPSDIDGLIDSILDG